MIFMRLGIVQEVMVIVGIQITNGFKWELLYHEMSGEIFKWEWRLIAF
jgi:hypothetical protein